MAESAEPVTVTLAPAKGVASVAQATAPAPKKRSTAKLLPAGKYLLGYSLDAEHGCSQSFETHGASGELVLEIVDDQVTARLDDTFSHSSGPSLGRYTSQGGAFQHDSQPRHLVFRGHQVADGDHVRVDLDGGIALACTQGEVELSPPIDSATPPAAPAPPPKTLKGFSCTGGSKMFDTEYDRMHSVAETLSFVPSTKLRLSGHTMGMGSAWGRLDLATD